MSAHDPAQQGWKTLPTIDAVVFAAARAQVHWAAQVIAAIGYTHLERADDDGQSNFGWVDGMQIFAGRYVDDPPVGFGSFAPASGNIAFHEPGGDDFQVIEPEGKALDVVYDEMAEAIAKRRGHEAVTLSRPPYEMPDHPLAGGAPFAATDANARQALAAWFHDANLVMRDLKAKTTDRTATLPRLWPHHFDLGMLISLEDDGDASEGRSIGIGLSPGDESDPLPYWYVNAYPAPKSIAGLDAPAVGGWIDDPFVGLKLDAATAIGDGTGQEARARGFVDEAVAICRSLLE